jgi:hypothetical protein
MGFGLTEIRAALRDARGNFERACSALLGDPTAREVLRHLHSEVLWVNDIRRMVYDGTLDADKATDVIRALLHKGENALTLWYHPVLGPALKRMSSVFVVRDTNAPTACSLPLHC